MQAERTKSWNCLSFCNPLEYCILMIRSLRALCNIQPSLLYVTYFVPEIMKQLQAQTKIVITSIKNQNIKFYDVVRVATATCR